MAAIGCDTLHIGSFGRIVLGELRGELEEAEFVGCVWRSYDQGTHMTNVDITAGNCESWHTLVAGVIP